MVNNSHWVVWENILGMYGKSTIELYGKPDWAVWGNLPLAKKWKCIGNLPLVCMGILPLCFMGKLPLDCMT